MWVLGCLLIFCRFSFQRGWPFRRRQLHAGTARFRKPNSDGLLRRSRTMLPFTNMMNLFTHEFTRLSGRGLPFTGIFPCSVNGFLLGHDGLYSQVLFS
jgi:hypothetical protein